MTVTREDGTEVPSKSFKSIVLYDFVTDPKLVPKVIGFREHDCTVTVVNIQPETEANFVTGLAADGSPVMTQLPIPQGTKAWVIISQPKP